MPQRFGGTATSQWPHTCLHCLAYLIHCRIGSQEDHLLHMADLHLGPKAPTAHLPITQPFLASKNLLLGTVSRDYAHGAEAVRLECYRLTPPVLTACQVPKSTESSLLVSSTSCWLWFLSVLLPWSHHACLTGPVHSTCSVCVPRALHTIALHGVDDKLR